MKRWMIAILFFAVLAGETSCVVRVKERSRPYPSSSPRAAATY